MSTMLVTQLFQELHEAELEYNAHGDDWMAGKVDGLKIAIAVIRRDRAEVERIKNGFVQPYPKCLQCGCYIKPDFHSISVDEGELCGETCYDDYTMP